MTLKRLLLLFSHHFRSFWIILAIGYFTHSAKNPFYFSYTLNDPHSNRSKGFGFVEMSTKAASDAVISAFNGYDLKGRPMNESE